MNETVIKTLSVTLVVCLLCSLLVSLTAVSLRDQQNTNKLNDKRVKILEAAKIYDDQKSIEEQFNDLEIRFLDFDTGNIFTEFKDYDLDNYDQIKSLRFSDQSKPVPTDKDIAIIKNRENIGKIYFSKKNNQIDTLILPIRGYGLWGTLYGYIAIENDFNTVVGIEFYEHKETPGLGGEVENPNWKKIWEGKKIYKAGNVELQVIKGSVDETMDDSIYMVDGLSGATLTSKGVSNMIEYWFSDSGYLKFLENLDYGS
tara:strand:+ start:789 stop:1559 length:771 start_codon:yes stop_codon:yes gene_type:complete